MEVDIVDSTENSSLDHRYQHQQQQQHLAVEANDGTEDDSKTETLSSETDQPLTSANEQSHGDDNGTVAATTSDSTVKDAEYIYDDFHYFVDLSPVDRSQESKPLRDGTGDDKEAVKMLEPERPEDTAAELTSNTPIEVTDVEDDNEILQDTRTQPSEFTELSGTEERTPAEVRTEMNNVETTDNALHHLSLHHHQQQQQNQKEELLEQNAGMHAEDAAQTALTSETTNSAAEENHSSENTDEKNHEDKEDQLHMPHERNNERDLEISCGTPQHRPETVEVFAELQTESTESGDGDHPLEDLAEVSVPDSKNEAGISTSVKTEPNSDDEQASMSSSLLSNPTRQLLPTSALLFPGDGPPVPVIEVTCGDCCAEFHLDRLVEGLGPVSNSIGTSRTSLCVRTIEVDGHGDWMTPNQFQRASGRGTARDWKRSIKHHGVSLKSLLSKAVLSFDANSPGCRCNICTVSVLSFLHLQSSFIPFFFSL